MILTPEISELCLWDHSQEQRYLSPKLQNDEEMLKTNSKQPIFWVLESGQDIQVLPPQDQIHFTS